MLSSILSFVITNPQKLSELLDEELDTLFELSTMTFMVKLIPKIPKRWLKYCIKKDNLEVFNIIQSKTDCAIDQIAYLVIDYNAHKIFVSCIVDRLTPQHITYMFYIDSSLLIYYLYQHDVNVSMEDIYICCANGNLKALKLIQFNKCEELVVACTYCQDFNKMIECIEYIDCEVTAPLIYELLLKQNIRSVTTLINYDLIPVPEEIWDQGWLPEYIQHYLLKNKIWPTHKYIHENIENTLFWINMEIDVYEDCCMQHIAAKCPDLYIKLPIYQNPIYNFIYTINYGCNSFHELIEYNFSSQSKIIRDYLRSSCSIYEFRVQTCMEEVLNRLSDYPILFQFESFARVLYDNKKLNTKNTQLFTTKYPEFKIGNLFEVINWDLLLTCVPSILSIVKNKLPEDMKTWDNLATSKYISAAYKHGLISRDYILKYAIITNLPSTLSPILPLSQNELNRILYTARYRIINWIRYHTESKVIA